MFLYILYNHIINKYYIGITNNINRRLEEHNKVSNGGYTKINKNWEIVFSKEYGEKEKALIEEQRLKRCKNRRYLEWYIQKYGSVAQ